MRKLILGTVQLGLDYGINNTIGKPTFEQSCEILSKSFDLGVNTLDTAEAYGNAHQIIGGFHKLNPAKKFNIITKIPHGVTLNNIQARVEQYLQDLEVEFLEVLMFHSFDTYKESLDDFNLLDNLKSKGLVKNIGVSVYTNEQIESLLNDKRVSVVQLPFNLFDNKMKRGIIIQKLKNAGKIVHTRSAFLQGLFFKDIDDSNRIVNSLKPELKLLKEFSNKYNVSIANMALAYCLQQNDIDQVLIGIDSERQLEENIKAGQCHLDYKLISEINSITIVNDELLNPSLWK